MEETRKDVVGYEGLYLVSDRGRIMSLKRNRVSEDRILKNQYDGNGYYYVTFVTDGKRINHKIHKLVAMAFIKNKDNKKTVNHIDGNKSNNNLWNLEWMTQQENILHAYSTGLTKGNRKRIGRFDIDGNLIDEWICAVDYTRKKGGSPSHITECARGEVISAYGYIRKYL